MLPLVGFFSIITGPLGEEFGWRGLLLPALLTRTAPWKAAIAVGATWALWHAPLWTFSDFITDLPAVSFIPLYIASVVAFSVVMTVLHLRSNGSVFLAMFAHAAFNACVLPFEALNDDCESAVAVSTSTTPRVRNAPSGRPRWRPLRRSRIFEP